MFIKSAKAFYSPIALFKDEAKSARFFPVKNGSEVQEGKKNRRMGGIFQIYLFSLRPYFLLNFSIRPCAAAKR